MSTLTIFIQQSPGIPSLSNQARERNKNTEIGKKNGICANDMLHVEKSKDYTHIHKGMSEFSEASGFEGRGNGEDWRGYHLWLTWLLNSDNWWLLTLWVLKYIFCPQFPQWKLLQGCSLERVRCY